LAPEVLAPHVLAPHVLAKALEAAAVGLTVFDARQPDAPLVYANHAFCEMTGHSAGTLRGHGWRLLVGPGSDPATVAAIAAAVAGRHAAVVEVLSQRRDGTPFWNALSLRPVADTDGQPRWLVGSSIDITARRQSKQELLDVESQLTKLAAETFALAEDLDRAREEAEAARLAAENASRAKSRFLAMMSHELRTPMTAVIGMGELLVATPLTQHQQGYVTALRSSADTLLTILNDILDFSKIEAGQLDLEDIDFALPTLVDDAIQLFLVRAAAKGLTLSASIAHDTPQVLRGDPTRLRQVLFNLLSNAIKFTHHGGIDVAVWSPGADETGIALRVDVTDTGIGITPEQERRLFEAFSQAEISTTRRYGGTGLGLTICRRLVAAMGGEIGLTSQPGGGTTFRFTIRLRPAEGPVPDSTHSHVVHNEGTAGSGGAKAAPSLRLLLAEDHDVNRMLIATMLTRMGHRIDAVGNGEAAIAALAGNDYDVVLLDMQMPVLDGMSTARAIRALAEPLCGIPIIGISADALPEHRQRHMATGLDAFLTKPIDWRRLGDTIIDLAAHPRGGARGEGRGRTAMYSPPTGGAGDEAADAMARLPLVDQVKLSELRLALGVSAIDDMLRLFPDTVLGEVTAIATGLAGGRFDDLRQAAHTLAGLAANFGAPRLAAVARRINDNHRDARLVAGLLPLLTATADETSRRLGARK
jgi:PAS domain S-box-containing protein